MHDPWNPENTQKKEKKENGKRNGPQEPIQLTQQVLSEQGNHCAQDRQSSKDHRCRPKRSKENDLEPFPVEVDW